MHDWTQTTLQAKNTVVTYHQVPVFNNSMPNRPLKTKNKHEINFNPLVLQVNVYRIKMRDCKAEYICSDSIPLLKRFV